MKQAQIKFTSAKPVPKTTPWLFGLLIVTLMATIWTAIESQEPTSEGPLLAKPKHSMPAQPASKSKRTQPSAKLLEMTDANNVANQASDASLTTQLASRKYAQIGLNIFNVQTWSPPLAKAKETVRPAPPPPMAPPIPYTYMGQIEEEGKVQFFVMQQNKLINLKIGQIISGQWRLDSETASHLNWTFMPTGLPQTLPKDKNQTNLAVSRAVFATPEQ